MRRFWKIEGLNAYTSYAAYKVQDRQTGKIYMTKMVVLKKSQYPKELLDFSGRFSYFGMVEEAHVKGVFKKRTIVTKPKLDFKQEEIVGAYAIQGISGLFTQTKCVYIRDKLTGKKYRRGKFQTFKDENCDIKFAELTGEYDLIFDGARL